VNQTGFRRRRADDRGGCETSRKSRKNEEALERYETDNDLAIIKQSAVLKPQINQISNATCVSLANIARPWSQLSTISQIIIIVIIIMSRVCQINKIQKN